VLDVERAEGSFELDVGHLLFIDNAVVSADIPASGEAREKALAALTRAGMQTLVHELWQLPTELVDGFPIAKMPAPTYRLPREKPVPVPKPPTKWETFAAQKGIQNRKRSRMDFDEETGKEMPRFGYGSKANDKNEMISVHVYNDQEDPYVDKFAELKEEKKERVAKNDSQRLRNLADRRKIAEKATSFAGKSAVVPALKEALDVSKMSTASAGKYDRKLQGEPKSKRRATRPGNKRVSVTNHLGDEKSRALKLLAKMDKGPVTISTNKGLRMADTTTKSMFSTAKKKKGKPERISAKGPMRKEKKSGNF